MKAITTDNTKHICPGDIIDDMYLTSSKMQTKTELQQLVGYDDFACGNWIDEEIEK